MVPIPPMIKLLGALGTPVVVFSCHAAAARAGDTPPAWLARLFPHTTTPDKFAHRLQRIEAEEVSVAGLTVGQVTCRFVYPELDGKRAEGQVRFFLPLALRGNLRGKLPLLHCAGYEANLEWTTPWLKDGFVVTTVHAHPLNPITRGPNLEYALLHAVRGLPFINDEKVYM